MSGDSGDAKLLYDTAVDNELQTVEVDVYVTEVDIYGNEFYLSYQSGINVQHAFEVNSYDFDVTKHIEEGTQKALFATKILYDGAIYDIIRHQSIKNTEKTLLICS